MLACARVLVIFSCFAYMLHHFCCQAIITTQAKMSINLTVLAGVLLLRRRRRQQTARRWWVHPLNQKRSNLGEYHHMMPDMRDDEEKFFRYLRMEFKPFDELLQKVAARIQRENTNFRSCIEPEERLVVTLR